jgi:50S ribosomal subunit-associated GTPase HflX
MEIKSAKGRQSSTVGGSGETQIEIETRLIKERENRLKKELEKIELNAEHKRR